MQTEVRAVTMPLVGRAARGALARYLGSPFNRCAVLESLRIGGASLDLLLLAGKGGSSAAAAMAISISSSSWVEAAGDGSGSG
jgi:hypothetical protein